MQIFKSPNKGFTLLEVLIAIMILAFISIAIFQTTTRSFELREDLKSESTFYNEIRLSMNIIDRDVAMLFNPLLMVPETSASPNPSQAQQQVVYNEEEFGRSIHFWGPPDRHGIRPMRFQGREDQMSFVALSNVRVYKDSPEAEFSAITFKLDDDPKANDPDEGAVGGKILVKTASPNAFEEDEDKDKYKKIYPLMRGVQRLVFSYYYKEKDRWESSWDSDKPDFKNIYPDAIKVTIEVKGPKNLGFEGAFQMKPEVPQRGIDPMY